MADVCLCMMCMWFFYAIRDKNSLLNELVCNDSLIVLQYGLIMESYALMSLFDEALESEFRAYVFSLVLWPLSVYSSCWRAAIAAGKFNRHGVEESSKYC